MSTKVGRMALMQVVARDIDTQQDFIIMKMMYIIFLIIYLRLEVVFIDCKPLIILLMLIAIWGKILMDILVLYFY